MPVPTPRALVLLAAGLLVPLLLGPSPPARWLLAGLDAAALLLILLDGRLAPGPDRLRAARRVRQPLSAFAPNRVELRVASAWGRAVAVRLADAPPSSFEAQGHRRRAVLPAGGDLALAYSVVPRSRGRHAFGPLFLWARGPLGLAWRTMALPIGQEVSVYPDLRPLAQVGGGASPEGGRARRGRREGREFEALRPYADGDDLRDVDWKATARRGVPVVRDWQPERNQTVWILLDCGRPLSARLADGRTKLDHAVDASLALARAAAARGDRTGAILFGAEVERLVPPSAGRSRLGPLAEALHLAQARPVESDYAAAFDALAARQRRRALVLLFTDLADADTTALLLARITPLLRRHLVLLAAVSDSEIAEVARARPRDQAAAFARAAAERILDEREHALRRLVAAGLAVASVPASALAAEVVARYAEIKGRGQL